MKKLPEVHDLEPEMLDFLERIEGIEGDTKRINGKIQAKSLEWSSYLSEMQRKLRYAKEELSDLTTKNQNMQQNFINLVGEFRTKASVEDLKKLQRNIDDLELEKIMYKDEFIKELSKTE